MVMEPSDADVDGLAVAAGAPGAEIAGGPVADGEGLGGRDAGRARCRNPVRFAAARATAVWSAASVVCHQRLLLGVDSAPDARG